MIVLDEVAELHDRVDHVGLLRPRRSAQPPLDAQSSASTRAIALAPDQATGWPVLSPSTAASTPLAWPSAQRTNSSEPGVCGLLSAGAPSRPACRPAR